MSQSARSETGGQRLGAIPLSFDRADESWDVLIPCFGLLKNMAFTGGDLLMTRATWRDGLIWSLHASGTARAVRCRMTFASLRLCATNTSSRQGAEAQRKQGCWYSDGAGGPGLGPSPFHQVPTSCVRIKAVRCGPSGVAKGLVSFLHPSRSSKAQATTCRPFRALFIFWHRPWARAAWLHHAAPFGADAYSRVWKNILGHLPVGVISSSSRTLWLTALHSALKAMPDDT